MLFCPIKSASAAALWGHTDCSILQEGGAVVATCGALAASCGARLTVFCALLTAYKCTVLMKFGESFFTLKNIIQLMFSSCTSVGHLVYFRDPLA